MTYGKKVDRDHEQPEAENKDGWRNPWIEPECWLRISGLLQQVFGIVELEDVCNCHKLDNNNEDPRKPVMWCKPSGCTSF